MGVLLATVEVDLSVEGIEGTEPGGLVELPEFVEIGDSMIGCRTGTVFGHQCGTVDGYLDTGDVVVIVALRL